MIADGLTKALPTQKFRNFIGMIGLVDIRDKLQAEKRLEAPTEQATDAAGATPSAVSEPDRKGEGRVAAQGPSQFVPEALTEGRAISLEGRASSAPSRPC